MTFGGKDLSNDLKLLFLEERKNVNKCECECDTLYTAKPSTIFFECLFVKKPRKNWTDVSWLFRVFSSSLKCFFLFCDLKRSCPRRFVSFQYLNGWTRTKSSLFCRQKEIVYFTNSFLIFCNWPRKTDGFFLTEMNSRKNGKHF